MNPLDTLSRILEEEDATQAQREALVDLVIWTMYIDGAIRYEENEQLDEIIRRLDLAADLPLRPYLYKAIARFRDVWHKHDQADETLRDIADRLGSDAMRRTAYDLSETVAGSDGRLAKAEHAFLERVWQQFGLEDE